MILPFRAYKSKNIFIEESTRRVAYCPITINLFDVRSYCQADNQTEGIQDTKPRTVVFLIDRSYLLDVSYEEFDFAFTECFKDYKLMDQRSISEKEEPVPDKIKYRGMMEFKSSQNKSSISTVFHRKGYEISDFDDAIFNCLFKNITPLN